MKKCKNILLYFVALIGMLVSVKSYFFEMEKGRKDVLRRGCVIERNVLAGNRPALQKKIIGKGGQK